MKSTQVRFNDAFAELQCVPHWKTHLFNHVFYNVVAPAVLFTVLASLVMFIGWAFVMLAWVALG